MNQLHPLNFGLAFGIMIGLFMFLLGLEAMTFGLWAGAVEMISVVYLGFEATLLGSVLGGLWGFVDGFVGGFVVAWIYNLLQKRGR